MSAGYARIHDISVDGSDREPPTTTKVGVRTRWVYQVVVRHHSRKDSSLHERGISDRALRVLVQGLGAHWLGLTTLSPHDLRHTWATRAQRGGTHPLALKVAGGLASLRMVERDAHAGAIANEDVVLA